MDVKRLEKNKKGLTLVEIIVVLAIIGILTALAISAIMKYISETADTKVQSQVRAGYVAAQFYAIDQIGENPGISGDDLTTKVNNADAINGELGLSKTGEGNDARYPGSAIKSIACTLTEEKIDRYETRVKGSNNTYTAAQIKVEEATKQSGRI